MFIIVVSPPLVEEKISHRYWGPLRGSSSPFLALWAGEG